MSRLIQRIRGAIGTAVLWAIGWCVAGTAVAATGLMGAATLGELALAAGIFAGVGFLGGAVFSVALTLIEGRKRFDQLSVPRFALWGGVGGVLVFGGMVVAGTVASLANLAFFVLLGSGSAAGTLALARVADGPALPADEDIDDVGLSSDEIKKLLGP